MKTRLLALAAALTVVSTALLGAPAQADAAAAPRYKLCYYGGKAYSHGAIIEGKDHDLKCHNGDWLKVNKPGGGPS